MIGTEIICPQCQAANGMTLADGNRLCFECRHEWNPDEALTLHAVGDAVAVLAVDLVLGPPAGELERREAQARVDAIIGRTVELEGGQLARVVEFPDDDHVTVNVAHSDDIAELVTVALGDVVREVAETPLEAVVPDAEAVLLGKTAIAVAGLCLNAALASLEGDTTDYRLTMPPTGWAPNDVDALPLFEQGVAYAIASLVLSYQLPRDIVAAMAETFLTDAQDAADV